MARKEYDCVMQFMLEEHSDPASALPIYIGLESNIADYRRNIFKWASPISKYTSFRKLDFILRCVLRCDIRVNLYL